MTTLVTIIVALLFGAGAAVATVYGFDWFVQALGAGEVGYFKTSGGMLGMPTPRDASCPLTAQTPNATATEQTTTTTATEKTATRRTIQLQTYGE